MTIRRTRSTVHIRVRTQQRHDRRPADITHRGGVSVLNTSESFACHSRMNIVGDFGVLPQVEQSRGTASPAALTAAFSTTRYDPLGGQNPAMGTGRLRL